MNADSNQRKLQTISAIESLAKRNTLKKMAQVGLTAGISSIVSKEALAQFVPLAFWKKKQVIPPASEVGPGFWMWGDNTSGLLGIGSTAVVTSLVQVDGTWSQVALGSSHSSALRPDGSLWMWGDNSIHQLGNGSTTSESSPVQLPGQWSQVACGATHSGALRPDGTLWMWGFAFHGQLGIGYVDFSEPSVSSPVQVSGQWSEVACGASHSGGIKTDGTLWMWGQNNVGQTGQYYGYAMIIDPTQIPGSWSQISLGNQHSGAIKTDGTLWMWGNNYGGQLGFSSVGDPYPVADSPRQVTGQWSQIACGATHSGALRPDGTLWMWGYNESGQLGNGSTSNTSSPVQVYGSWSQIAFGGGHSSGLRTDGTLWTWGDNEKGQLGLGPDYEETLFVTSPIQIAGSWSQISLGSTSSGGIKT